MTPATFKIISHHKIIVIVRSFYWFSLEIILPFLRRHIVEYNAASGEIHKIQFNYYLH